MLVPVLQLVVKCLQSTVAGRPLILSDSPGSGPWEGEGLGRRVRKEKG